MQKLPGYLILLFGLALIAYTGSRAFMLSMTHDEAHTFNAFMDLFVWSCLWDPGCWEIANNHLLNTWLIQLSTQLFGIHELTIRLPNVLAHALYMISCYGILKQITQQSWWLLFGFALLNMNPYLLDFFSMARGYGLMVAFLMFAVYQYVRFLITTRWIYSLGIFLSIALAILSNFTALNPGFVLLTLYFLLLFYKYSVQKAIELNWRHVVIPILCVFMLGLLLYVPIITLKDKGEFLWGAQNLSDTFRVLIKSTLYHEGYFGKNTLYIFNGLFVIMLIAGTIWMLWKIVRLHLKNNDLIYYSSFLLLFGSILFMVLQHWILGSQYLVDRKAIHFIPWASLFCFIWLYQMPKFRRNLIVLIFATFFAINHWIRTINFDGTWEWYYDVDTKRMMQDMDQLAPDQGTISLGLNWLFMPSAEFYKNYYNYTFLDPLQYSKVLQPEADFDYYYVESQDYPVLQEKYLIHRHYGGGRMLLKHK